MTMNFNRKTCMRLAAGTVLCGGAALGGLLWWQLQAFDRMTDSRLERGMGLFALELERRDGGLLQRDLVLRLGFRTEDGLTESFLVMNGRFRPGLRPSVSFEPVANSDPDAAILVKADPRIRFVFSPLMSPEEAEVVWRGASDEKETIGDGRVTADIGFDHARRALTGLTVSGRLGASESRWEGGHVKSAEKTFEYVYAESPLKFAFSYSSAGDFVKGELMPLGMGPLSYSLTVTPEEEAGRLRNATDFKFDIRDVNINDSELPVFDLRFDAGLYTPPNVWLPCLSAHFVLGSDMADLPGICPDGSMTDIFAASMQGNVEGVVRDLRLAWAGAELTLKGSFVNHGFPGGKFETGVSFVDTGKGPVPGSVDALNRDLRQYVEALEKEGAVKRVGEDAYETTLEFRLTPEGILKTTANGRDMDESKAAFHWGLPSTEPSEIIIKISPKAEPYLTKGVDAAVVEPIEKLLTGLDAVQRWSSTRNEYGAQVLVITVDDLARAPEVVEALDVRLEQIKEVVQDAVVMEMRFAPEAMPAEWE